MSGRHERFKAQLPAYALGALEPGERTDLSHHLDSCAECRAELAWLQPAVGALSADVQQIEPPPGLRARVMAEVDADLAESPSPATAPRPARPRRDDRGWLSGFLRPATFGLAAAALLIGVVLGIALDGGGGSPTGPDRQVLTGQSSIGAQAVMVASDGTGTLRMTNLDALNRDQVYQAWIQRGQKVEPTEALFVPNHKGSATASIPDLSGVDAVMVSAEPKGGSDQPTTAPVITVSMPG